VNYRSIMLMYYRSSMIVNYRSIMVMYERTRIIIY